ncbi:MAG: HD domain-containing protein [Chloroflexi bacterium]|nr:HD domain-containing protein [Chloroflexota bacterium]
MPNIEQAQAWYREADPVHDFSHVLRVCQMAERIAEAEGADLEIVRAASLLHDVEGSSPEVGETRTDHHEKSAAFARQVLLKEGWQEERILAVEHCIRAHRYRSTEQPQSLEAKILFDADKLDVLGAIGAARTVAYAVLAGEPIFSEPSAKFLESGEKEFREAHSSYHEYLFKLVKVKDRLYTTEGKRLAAARHQFLIEFYDQLAAEVEGKR